MLFMVIALAAWASILTLVIASCLLAKEDERHGAEILQVTADPGPRSCERRLRPKGAASRRPARAHGHRGARHLRAFPGR